MKFLRMLLLLTAGLLLLSCASDDYYSRRIAVSGKPTAVRKLAVVLPESTRLLEFAAAELQAILEQATGCQVPVQKSIGNEDVSLILGNNALLKEAGLNLDCLPDEGYYIHRCGNRIFLAGRDAEDSYPSQNSWGQHYLRGTLSAVYDFLERFAGARFYFPGEFGTIIPEKDALYLPKSIAIVDGPDCTMRKYYNGNGCRWYDDQTYNGVQANNLNLLRLRLEERSISFSHGLAYLDFPRRFGKTQPEYFALTADGRRMDGTISTTPHSEQLCLNSGIREVVFQDAKDYLSARDAAERLAAAQQRGLQCWSLNVATPGFFCVMPNDYLYWCHCDKCAPTARGGRLYADWTAEELRKLNNALWGFTADIARKIELAGVEGFVTQMAYGVGKNVPDIDLPANVLVQLAVKGLGADKQENAEEDALLRRWCEKTGMKVALWTYPGKHMAKAAFKGIPVMIPETIGKYFRERKKYIFGSFLESETDYFIFNYLSYYVYAKISWDLNADSKAILAEHYQLMYGQAAALFQEMFRTMEELWTKRIVGSTIDSSLGPVAKLPTDLELWSQIYSPQLLQDFNTKLDQAERLTADNPQALKRVRFIREKLFGPLYAQAEQHAQALAAIAAWKVSVPGEVQLRPFKGKITEVQTLVKIADTPEALLITFHCQEPAIEQMVRKAQRRDEQDIYLDSCVEVLINPSGDRVNYCHFIVNANGALYDSRMASNKKGIALSWNSSATVKCEVGQDFWQVVLTLPKKDLGQLAAEGVPVNFARHRALEPAVDENYYQWAPVAGRSFHDIERWGRMLLKP